MNLLGTEAYRNSLATALSHAKYSVVIISAFVTKAGCEWVNNHLHNSNVSVYFIVRWRLQDLLAGASDLDSYEYANAHGWTFCVQPDMHSKIILVDNRIIHLGSANVTNNGLALTPGGNNEHGVVFSASERDLEVIKAIQNECVYMSPELYQEIKTHIDNLPSYDKGEKNDVHWPFQLQIRFLQPPKKMWVADFLWSPPPSETVGIKLSTNNSCELEHDMKLLGIHIPIQGGDKGDLMRAFQSSRVYQWLKYQLDQNDGQLFFGELTTKLHAALLDDPAPYRKDVKGLASNLLSWVKSLNIPELEVDVPGRFSQRIRFSP